jgi:hypothetical protein
LAIIRMLATAAMTIPTAAGANPTTAVRSGL